MGPSRSLALVGLAIRELELVVGCFSAIEGDGVLLLIALPIREVLPELMRVLELAVGCFAPDFGGLS